MPIYYVIAGTLFLVCGIITRRISRGLLAAYIFLVLATTILRRIPSEQASVILTPFWSYREMNSNSFIWFEVRANILLFVPMGFLLPLNVNKWPLLWGVCFSILIEIAQFITHRGTCETDDVISNTIGFLIGYVIITALRFIRNKSLELWKILQK